MHFTRITSAYHPLYPQAMALYQISFPPHEQREALSQSDILRPDAYHFDAICDGDTFVEEILYWEVAGLLYIEHFCILPEMRNRHYGQKALAMLQDWPMLLEIDPPVDEISIRRNGFYTRCGFVENSYPHVHPPYHRGNHGHDLVIMSSPRQLTQTEYDTFRRYLQDTGMNGTYH